MFFVNIITNITLGFIVKILPTFSCTPFGPSQSYYFEIRGCIIVKQYREF